jgi:long-chain acyl-CoA synthetase
MTGVNTLYAGLLQNEEFKNLNFDKLDAALAGGMATQTETIRKWKEVTGKNLYEGYGLTETSPVLTL